MRRVAVSLFFMILLGTQAASAAEWHNSFGIGVIDVNDDLEDIHRSNLQAENIDDTDFETALNWGYFYQPYYLYDNGFAWGLGIATPTGIIAEEIFLNTPLHVDVRYFISAGAEFTAYIRAGIRYNVAIGEYVEGTNPGSILGVGLLFNWNEQTKIGIEYVDDNSEVEIRDVANNRTEAINLNQSIVSLIVAF